VDKRVLYIRDKEQKKQEALRLRYNAIGLDEIPGSGTSYRLGNELTESDTWLSDALVKQRITIQELQQRLATMEVALKSANPIQEILQLREEVARVNYSSQKAVVTQVALQNLSGKVYLVRDLNVPVRKVESRYDVQSFTRVLFIKGAGSPWKQLAEDKDCFEAFKDDTPSSLTYVHEIIPTCVNVSLKVATVSGMTLTDWDNLTPGIDIDTFPYALTNIVDLPDQRGCLLSQNNVLQDKYPLGYLEKAEGFKILGRIANAALSFIEFIPVVGGFVGMAIDGLNTFGSLLSGSNVTLDPDAYTPSVGFFDRMLVSTSGKYKTVTSLVNLSYVKNTYDGFNTVDSDINPTNIALIRSTPGPKIENRDVGFLGGNECRLSTYNTITTGSRDISVSQAKNYIGVADSLGDDGLLGGKAQYAVEYFINLPEEIAKDRSKVSGFNIVFLDNRPLACFYPTSGWHERPDLV
jgi:hypothetical protein